MCENGACLHHCSTIRRINIQFTKVQQLQKRVRNFKLPDPAGYSILFTTVSDDVLTNLQQL